MDMIFTVVGPVFPLIGFVQNQQHTPAPKTVNGIWQLYTGLTVIFLYVYQN